MMSIMRRVVVLSAAVKRQLGNRTVIPAATASTQHPVRFLSDLTKQKSSYSPPSRTNTSKDGVVGFPIDFDVDSKIEGNESQVSIVSVVMNIVAYNE